MKILNKSALKAEMIIHSDTGKTLAKFTQTEIAKIKQRYDLSAQDIDNIFF